MSDEVPQILERTIDLLVTRIFNGGSGYGFGLGPTEIRERLAGPGDLPHLTRLAVTASVHRQKQAEQVFPNRNEQSHNLSVAAQLSYRSRQTINDAHFQRLCIARHQFTPAGIDGGSLRMITPIRKSVGVSGPMLKLQG